MRNYENPLVTSENRMNPRSYYIPEGVSELQMLSGVLNITNEILMSKMKLQTGTR